MSNVGAQVPQVLTVDVYPGPSSSFLLYEDDGISFDYTTGAYLKTQIAKTLLAAGNELDITRKEGNWLPPARSLSVYYHNFSAPPKSVQWNGVPVLPVATEAALANVTAGWFLRAADNRLIVRVASLGNPLQITVLQ
jgi:alpha-glucosidase